MNNILVKIYFPAIKVKRCSFHLHPSHPPSQKKKKIALTLGRVNYAHNTDTVCLIYKGNWLHWTNLKAKTLHCFVIHNYFYWPIILKFIEFLIFLDFLVNKTYSCTFHLIYIRSVFILFSYRKSREVWALI